MTSPSHVVRVICVFAAMLGVIGRSWADVVDGAFNHAITDQKAWTGPTLDGRARLDRWREIVSMIRSEPSLAGRASEGDELGRWYGSEFAVVSAAAATTELPTKNQSRSLMQALPMPVSGTYKLSVDVRFTSGPDQQIFWHVLGVEEGVTLNLTNSGIPRSIRQSGVKSLWVGHVHNHQDKEKWFTYENKFWVSPEDAKQFAYLVVAFVGIRPRGCIAEFDNVVTDVPYSSSKSSEGIEVEWYNTPKNISRLNQINWDSPFMTTTEPAINWSNRTTTFRQSVPVEYFGLRARGFITVPIPGLWTFELGSDDGSRLLIDGRTVVDQDRLQSYTRRTGQLELEAGQHPIEVTFFERTGHQGLVLSWRGPGERTFRAIEPEAFSTVASDAQPKRARIVRWTEASTIDE